MEGWRGGWNRVVAVLLPTVVCVLRCEDHGDGVVDSQDNEREHHCTDEHTLRLCGAWPELKQRYPQEPDTNKRNPHNTGNKKQQDNQKCKDVVDREHFRGLNKHPVHRVENVGVGKDVATAFPARRVLNLVDRRDKHGCNDEHRKSQDQNTKQDLKRAADGLELEIEPLGLGVAKLFRNPLATHKSALFALQRLQLAPVLGSRSLSAVLVLPVQNSLSLAVDCQCFARRCSPGRHHRCRRD